MVLNKRNYIYIGILLLFGIYVCFSDYIYGTAFRVDGESKKSSTGIPPEMSNIISNIESVSVVKTQWKELVRIQGWAVNPQQVESQNNYHIMLKSQTNKVIYETSNYERPDIFNIHKQKNSGFISLIAIDAIPDGRYQIGIINANTEKQYLAYTNFYLSKIDSLFYDKFIAKEYYIKIPRDTSTFDLKLEVVQPVILKEKEFLRIQCFAITPIDKQTHAYFTLNDGKRRLIYDAISMKRPDVVSAYNNSELMNSGVETYIPKGPKLKGNFKIGLLLLKSEPFYAEGSQIYAVQ